MKSITGSMVWPRAVSLAALVVTMAASAPAGTFSESGMLQNPEDSVTFTLQLHFNGSVFLQTYGFGGGTNAAGSTISPGGFDPFVGMFAGTGPTATFIDGTSDALSNYTSEPSACPPAGTVTVGSVAGQCGDVRLQISGLTAGLYTILLSDAEYYPNAVSETPPALLGDGFTDLTGGSLPFQTCVDQTDCNTDTQNWALDILAPEESVLFAPEPASFELTGFGLIGAAGFVVLGRLPRRRRP